MDLFISFGRSIINSAAELYTWLTETSFTVLDKTYTAFDIFGSAFIGLIIAMIIYHYVNPFD